MRTTVGHRNDPVFSGLLLLLLLLARAQHHHPLDAVSQLTAASTGRHAQQRVGGRIVRFRRQHTGSYYKKLLLIF